MGVFGSRTLSETGIRRIDNTIFVNKTQQERKTMKNIHIGVLAFMMSTSAFGQWAQSYYSQNDPQQVFAAYEAWFQNANYQLTARTSGLPPIMQLQCAINVIEGELSQWGGFLQQYYPLVYAGRCAALQQRRQLFAMMSNQISMPSSVSFANQMTPAQELWILECEKRNHAREAEQRRKMHERTRIRINESMPRYSGK